MTDRIFLDNLRLKCRIGITPEERIEPQEVVVGIEMALSLERAGKSDDLSDTVNYREVMQRVSEFVSAGEFNLLESLAEGIASLALEEFGVGGVTVRVRKAKYSSEPSIGIQIQRGGDPWSNPS